MLPPPIPLDTVALDLIDHALDAVIEVDDDGNHHLAGADMTLDRLLEFWSGPSDSTLIGYTNGFPFGSEPLTDGDIPIYQRELPRYSEHDLIRALVAEVRQLRTGNQENQQ